MERLPLLLVLCLKRFKDDGKKDKAVVGVTRQQDLTPYVRGAVKQGVHLEYHPGVKVKHRGGDAAGGHYICQA